MIFTAAQQAVGALAVAASGNAALMAAAADGGTGVAPYVQSGGSAAAVAGLVYVARLIAKGELVPRAVKDSENELRGQVLVQAQREEKAMELAEETLTARKADAERHDRALLLLARVDQDLSTVAQEMSYWRAMRQRGTRTTDDRMGERE